MIYLKEMEVRGEIPLEPRASWFFSKCVEAQQLTGYLGVKHCFGVGRESGIKYSFPLYEREPLLREMGFFSSLSFFFLLFFLF